MSIQHIRIWHVEQFEFVFACIVVPTYIHFYCHLLQGDYCICRRHGGFCHDIKYTDINDSDFTFLLIENNARKSYINIFDGFTFIRKYKSEDRLDRGIDSSINK